MTRIYWTAYYGRGERHLINNHADHELQPGNNNHADRSTGKSERELLSANIDRIVLRTTPSLVSALTGQPRIDVLHIIIRIDGFQESLDFFAFRFTQDHRIFGAIAQFGRLHDESIVR